MVKIKPDETLDDLTKFNRKIIQKKDGFRFAIDAVLISNFVDIRRESKVVDIGTGTGIIPLLLSDNSKIKNMYAFEIQEEVADMAARSITYNNLNQKILILNENVKNTKNIREIDIIVSNPPYIKKQDGKLSCNPTKAISRHEIELTLEELLCTSKKMLKSGGSLNIIYRTNRFQEMMEMMSGFNFNVKRVRFIYSKPGKCSNLFMVEAIKDKNCQIKILEPLYIFDENDDYTKEVLEYY